MEKLNSEMKNYNLNEEAETEEKKGCLQKWST